MLWANGGEARNTSPWMGCSLVKSTRLIINEFVVGFIVEHKKKSYRTCTVSFDRLV
jgi:hypothetical protein